MEARGHDVEYGDEATIHVGIQGVIDCGLQHQYLKCELMEKERTWPSHSWYQEENQPERGRS